MDYLKLPYDPITKKEVEVDSLLVRYLKSDDLQLLDLPAVFKVFAIFYVTRGEAQLTYGSNSYDIKEGNVTIVFPGQALSTVRVGDTELTAVYISSNFMLQVGEPLLDMESILSGIGRFISIDVENKEFLSGLIARIYEELQQDQKHKGELMKAYLTELLVFLNRWADETGVDVENYHHPLVRKFLSLVVLSTVSNRSVSWYAKKLDISANYLNMVVKNETGKNAKMFIQQKVLMDAKQLLVNTDLDVKTVAQELGFDPDYFYHFFRRLEKKTPLQFRMEHKI